MHQVGNQYIVIMKMIYRRTAHPFLISCACPFLPHHKMQSYYALFNFHGQVAPLHRQAAPFFHASRNNTWPPNIVTESNRPQQCNNITLNYHLIKQYQLNMLFDGWKVKPHFHNRYIWQKSLLWIFSKPWVRYKYRQLVRLPSTVDICDTSQRNEWQLYGWTSHSVSNS